MKGEREYGCTRIKRSEFIQYTISELFDRHTYPPSASPFNSLL